MAIRYQDYMSKLPEQDRKMIEYMSDKLIGLEMIKESIRMALGDIEFVVSNLRDQEAANVIQERLEYINELLDQA